MWKPDGLSADQAQLVWLDKVNSGEGRSLEIGKTFSPWVTDSQDWRRKIGKLTLCLC